jgi:hypothetical protein
VEASTASQQMPWKKPNNQEEEIPETKVHNEMKVPVKPKPKSEVTYKEMKHELTVWKGLPFCLKPSSRQSKSWDEKKRPGSTSMSTVNLRIFLSSKRGLLKQLVSTLKIGSTGQKNSNTRGGMSCRKNRNKLWQCLGDTRVNGTTLAAFCL